MSQDTPLSAASVRSSLEATQSGVTANRGQVSLVATVTAAGVAFTGLLITAGSIAAAGVVTVGMTLGVLLAVSIVIVAIDRPIRALVGGVLLLGSVTGAVGLPIVVGTRLTPATGALAAASALVGFGLTQSRLPVFGSSGIATALGWLARVTLVLLATAVTVGVVTLDLATVITTAGTAVPIAPLLTPSATGTATVGFVAVSWLAYGGVWLATVAAPVSSLLSPERRARVDPTLQRVLRGVGGVCGVGSILVAVAYALLMTGSVLPGVVPIVAAVVESATLRATLLRVGLAGVVVTALVTLIRSITSTAVGTRPTWLPSAVIVTTVLTAVSVAVGERVVAALVMIGPTSEITLVASLTGPTTVGLMSFVAGVIGIGVLLAVAPVASAVGVIPARTAGARLVLLGLIAAAVTVALADGGIVRLLFGVAAGVVAWDIAAYDAEITADIGPTPAQRDGAVVHVVSTTLIGAVTVVGAYLAFLTLTRVSDVITGTITTAALAGVSVVVLVVLLRR